MAYCDGVAIAFGGRRPGVAKYHHVASTLRQRILAGEHAPGEQLPSEASLCAEFGYDRGTIRRGIAVLQHEGLVSSEQGSRTRVRRNQLLRSDLVGIVREHRHVQEGTAPTRGLFELATGAASGDVDVQIEYESVAAPDDVAAAFGCSPGTMLLARHYLFTVDTRAHQLSTSYLPEAITKGTPIADRSNERPGRGTLAQLADVGIAISAVRADLSSRMPTPDEVATFDLPVGVPVMVGRTSLVATNHDVVCFAVTVTPADRIRIGLDIKLTENGAEVLVPPDSNQS